MRILLCDDNKLFLKELRQYISMFFNERELKLPEILCFENGEALLSDSGIKDLVFLDVQMPGPNGIEITNALKESNPKTIIIIISAFHDYIDDAMSSHVFRYLDKPLDPARLYRSLQNALAEYALQASKTAIETKDQVITVYTSDIICVETHKRKTLVHTTNGSFDSIKAMQHWQTVLTQPCFVQCYRSFLVNLSHVVNFTHDSVHLDNGLRAYLSKKKYTAFKNAYMLFLESTG